MWSNCRQPTQLDSLILNTDPFLLVELVITEITQISQVSFENEIRGSVCVFSFGKRVSTSITQSDYVSTLLHPYVWGHGGVKILLLRVCGKDCFR